MFYIFGTVFAIYPPNDLNKESEKMKRLNLIELHLNRMNKYIMGKVKGGRDIKCICSYTNPLVSTREAGGSGSLCFCLETEGPVSVGVQNKPLNIAH